MPAPSPVLADKPIRIAVRGWLTRMVRAWAWLAADAAGFHQEPEAMRRAAGQRSCHPTRRCIGAPAGRPHRRQYPCRRWHRQPLSRHRAARPHSRGAHRDQATCERLHRVPAQPIRPSRPLDGLPAGAKVGPIGTRAEDSRAATTQRNNRGPMPTHAPARGAAAHCPSPTEARKRRQAIVPTAASAAHRVRRPAGGPAPRSVWQHRRINQ